MKCLSRSTLGVVIGAINIFGFSVTVIYIITVLCDFSGLSEEDKREYDDVLSTSVTLLYILLVICVIAIIISGLLIAGIVKRRQSLMKPWIYSAAAGIFCHTFRIVIGFIGGFVAGLPFGDVFWAFILGLLTLGLQVLIFYPIYKLYKDLQVSSGNEQEHTNLNTDQDNPPSYGELEKTGRLCN
ncbi:uncharacterized protein LOC119615868 [Lucilia sericata]|uniref:uncharacterized protein LOC119615868 n=1 Tax=Lucilia sericata TaxID=13632 RepID=UPI0018A85506|nr:uncharacterized protein LOC119615868 [Lucilia sericata]